MPGRIVEIAEDNRYLNTERGFLVVSSGKQEIGRIPLDDIDALVTHANGLVYSNNLLVRLAERNIPFVLCADNHNPVGLLLSIVGYHAQAKRFDTQIAASKPTNKRLWASIIKSKITFQAQILSEFSINTIPVRSLIEKVKTGDGTNVEAQAARRYWRLLFGDEFRRDRDRNDINSLLNYGYTVLRAGCARAVLSAGLHPTLGIHHTNESNGMRLVDDIVEPFRPIVDYVVKTIANDLSDVTLTPEIKAKLVHCLYTDMQTVDGKSPASVCMQRLATSLAQVYSGDRRLLDLPSSICFKDLNSD